MNKFSSRSYPHSAYNHLILGYPSSGRRKWVFFMGWIEIICYGPEGKPFRILREFEKNSRPDQDGTSIIFDTFISFQTLITAVLFPQSWIMKLISPRGYIVGVRDTSWPVVQFCTPDSTHFGFFSSDKNMSTFSVVAGAALLLLIATKFLWRFGSTKYRLPPGPKRDPIFGNLFELILSTIKGEAPFVKFSKWALQVT